MPNSPISIVAINLISERKRLPPAQKNYNDLTVDPNAPEYEPYYTEEVFTGDIFTGDILENAAVVDLMSNLNRQHP